MGIMVISQATNVPVGNRCFCLSLTFAKRAQLQQSSSLLTHTHAQSLQINPNVWRERTCKEKYMSTHHFEKGVKRKPSPICRVLFKLLKIPQTQLPIIDKNLKSKNFDKILTTPECWFEHELQPDDQVLELKIFALILPRLVSIFYYPHQFVLGGFQLILSSTFFDMLRSGFNL